MTLAIDASSPAALAAAAVGSTTITTASFSPPACVLYAFATWDAAPPSTVTAPITDNKSLVWNLSVRKNNNTGAGGNEGTVEIWWANVSAPLSGLTVTTTATGAGLASTYGMLQV